MIRIACVVLFAFALIFFGIQVVNLYDDLLPVGRMWETPAVRSHEQPLPVMAAGSVPWTGGEALYRTADPEILQPPAPLDDPERIARGVRAYGFYCIHCHGPQFDGYGTVGQSFAPTPRDLRSAAVQALSPGKVFHEISYGIPDGRQPPLATTMSVDERWDVIAYIRSLGLRE
jgi:mono/diheme cytochrome c family protein